ncbi:hypothetical protein [Flagellimonas sp. 2504JD1-5]
MKTILSIITLGLVCCCSSVKNFEIAKEVTFKSITMAGYSTKRTGEITREQAFAQSLDRKNFYDKKGELIEYWKYERDGTIYQKVKLEKNQHGKLIKSISFDGEGNLKKYMNTEFDDNGNIIEYKTYNPNDELTSRQINEYDLNGNIISMSRTNTVSNKTFKTTSKYNLANQLIEETDFKPDNSIKDIRTFKYNDKGNEIESDLTRPNGDYTKFISEYDDQNNVISQYWYDKSGNQKHWNTFSYVYDKNNKWITKKRYSNGELGYVWERQIEYN